MLQEVLTLEKAYHYTINMELFSAHTQKFNTTWLATSEVMRLVQSTPVSSPATPLPLVGLPAAPIPLLPLPPLRLLLPAHPPLMPNPPTIVGYENRVGTPAGPPTVGSVVNNSTVLEGPAEGRTIGGVQP